MKFLKPIIRPGTYLTRKMLRDGTSTRAEVTITPERIQHWAKQFKAMREAGLLVPAPWRHDKGAKPLSEEEEKKKKESGESSSKDNAGFWEDLRVTPDGTLEGILDVPLQADADLVGKTVREVSPMYLPDWKDGLGRNWEDSIYHIALVTHPIVPGQENFRQLPEESATAASHDVYDNAECIALSHLIARTFPEEESMPDVTNEQKDLNEKERGFLSRLIHYCMSGDPAGEKKDDSLPTGASNATLKDALKVLSSLGLTLPDDTLPENLVERIVTAGLAITNSKKDDEEEDLTKNAQEEPSPVAMSHGDPDVTTPNPFQDFATKQAKTRLSARIETLVKSGRVSKKVVDENIQPLLEGYALSLGDDGNPQPTELDRLLNILEAAPANRMLGNGHFIPGNDNATALSHGVTEEDIPTDMLVSPGMDVTEERADEILNSQFAAAGRHDSVRR